MRKFVRFAFLTLTGVVFGFGGCLGLNWQRLLLDTAVYAGQEFLFDGGVLDLFPEDGAAANGG